MLGINKARPLALPYLLIITGVISSEIQFFGKDMLLIGFFITD
jgi:hypothetical protein